MKDFKDMTIAEKIDLLESVKPNCGCRGWDCYDCYQDGQIEIDLEKFKKEQADEQNSRGEIR